MQSFSRAQSGLEYLMTYGWSLILIVSIASVLFFILSSNTATQPVFSSSNPAKILLKSGNVSVNTVEFFLQNATGGRMSISSLSSAEYSSCTVNGSTLPVNIDGGGTMKINCTAPTSGKGNLQINYTDFSGNAKSVSITSSGTNPTANTPVPDECSLALECDDSVSCTLDDCTGNPKTCTHTAITACTNNDNCCPGGCVFATDNDCPDTSIIAFFKFEEASGTSTTDNSGHGYNGTLTNGPVWATTGCASGNCLQFDGTNDYVEFGDVLDAGSNNWTVSAWFNSTNASSDRIIYNKENLYEAKAIGNYSEYAWQPHWNWDGSGNFSVVQGQWYHIVVKYDHSNQYFYKNGALVYQRAQTGDIGNNSENFRIGARAGPASFFYGKLDEIKIFNRSITSGEVCSLCNENAPATGVSCGC